MENYYSLLKLFEEIELITSVDELLYWDQSTYMPETGSEYRAQQFAFLSILLHQKSSSQEIRELVNLCEKNDKLNDLQKRNVLLIRRILDNASVLPSELVGQIAEQSSKTTNLWMKARKQNNFDMVSSDLEKLFSLTLQKAELIARLEENSDPYDALLRNYEPGLSVDLLTTLFSEARDFLVPFLKQILSSTVKYDTSFLDRELPLERKKLLVQDIVQYLGYDLNSGSLDQVEHPFTVACGLGDVRITVDYNEGNVLGAFFAGAHETGHALDYMERNADWNLQPVNFGWYSGFCESQSRFYENMICRSKEFWIYYFPRFQKLTDGIFDDVDFESFYYAINEVKPDLIRVEANEITYLLHVIIRFELEKELFAGKLAIKDLPSAWNKKYKEYLGVEVPSDTLGVLQDVHWYSEGFAQFYGYGLGDIIASQITHTLTKELPDWKELLQEGKVSAIRKWVEEKVHKNGLRYDTDQLVKKITGEKIKTFYFIEYLKNKFSNLYNID
ncbi:MAG: carboxypeptidase M32 [Candidatus Kariarchaeaceae archaeon]